MAQQFNYNGQANEPGIYVIFNSLKWRIYVGQTWCFKDRWRDHVKSLKANRHLNKFLQADFNLCGESAFEFHVLEVMPGSTKQSRNLREDHWIDVHYDNQKTCYNFKKLSTSLPRTCYSKSPEETSNILSEKAKAQWADPEKRALILARQKETLKPDHMTKALSVRWTGPDSLAQRQSMSTKTKVRWEQKTPEETNKILTGLARGRLPEVYAKKHEKSFEKLKAKASLVREIKTFAGKKQNKAKMFVGANLVSPDGMTMYSDIYNLRDFAKHVGVSDSWKLQEVILGVRPSYLAWTKSI